MDQKLFAVYILTNVAHTVFYVGVTNDLLRRLLEHAEKRQGSFTAQYQVIKLVHVEFVENVESAIAREKQIKGWRREKKLALIQSDNHGWIDLKKKYFPEQFR